MKKLSLLLCFLYTAFTSYSQQSIALITGLQNATFSNDYISYPDTSIRKSSQDKIYPHIGLVANIPLKGKLYFQTGVLYAAKGSDWTQIYDTANLYANTVGVPEKQKRKLLSGNTNMNLGYMEVPFNLMLRFSLKGSTHIYFGGGPQLSLFFDGRQKYNTFSVSQAHPDSTVFHYFKETENDDLPIGKRPGQYRILHWGAKLYGGIEFGRAFLNIHYSRDLEVFYREEERQYKAETLGFGLGIFLGPRQKKTKKQ